MAYEFDDVLSYLVCDDHITCGTQKSSTKSACGPSRSKPQSACGTASGSGPKSRGGC